MGLVSEAIQRLLCYRAGDDQTKCWRRDFKDTGCISGVIFMYEVEVDTFSEDITTSELNVNLTRHTSLAQIYGEKFALHTCVGPQKLHTNHWAHL